MREDLASQLKKIYQSPDNFQTPNRLESKVTSHKKIIIWSLLISLLFFSLIFSLGYFIFTHTPSKFTGEGMSLKLRGPQEIASGEEIIYVFTYENGEEVGAKNLSLSVHFPSGFRFNFSSPFLPRKESNYEWNLGNLKSGDKGKLEVSGSLFGEIGELKTLSAFLAFEPENFSSYFKKAVFLKTSISTSGIELVIKGPEKILVNPVRDLSLNGVNQEIEYHLIYKNILKNPLEDIYLKVFYPSGFKLSYLDPQPTRENLWLVKNLKSGEEREILLKGFLNENEIEESKEIIIQAGFLEDGLFYLLREISFESLIVVPELSLDLRLNNSEENQIAHLGEILDFVLSYKNTGNLILKNIEIKIRTERNNEILEKWNRADRLEQLPLPIQFELTSLRPDEEGKFEFQVKLLDKLPALILNSKTADLSLSFQGQAKALADEPGEKYESESHILTVKISTELDLRLEARYFNDELIPLGFGPLPPRLGETTSYQIYWYLKNTTSRVNDLEIKTTLPEGVKWLHESKVSQGNLIFNPETYEILWYIPTLASFEGGSWSNVSLSFKVSITPASQDIGRLMILTQDTYLEGRDEFSGEKLSLRRDFLTTDLKEDPVARGQGIIEN